MKGSHIDKPRGRGRDGGGGLRRSGSTIDAHEEWMPIMIRHELEIVKPWVGNAVSVEDMHQPVDLSDVANDLTHLPSLSGMMMATIIWRDQIARSCETIVAWSCQN